MTCLRVDQIYLYLEEELSSSENERIEKHLVSCPKCQNAVQERRLLLQAANSLPVWDTPADFTSQIMARIFPSRVPIWKWIAVSAAGFSSAALVLLAYFLISGQSLVGSLNSLGHSTLDAFRSASVLFLKVVKLLSLLIRVIVQIFGIIVDFFARLTTIISPEIQIVLITLTLILSVSLFFGVRKKILTGEKA